jgi:glycosyltransferase involved in cell wall biosynthesis
MRLGSCHRVHAAMVEPRPAFGGEVGRAVKVDPRERPVSTSISVVIPTRNRAALLPGLIQAVLDQSDPAADEVFVVDDGSDDETPAVLQRLAQSDPRVVPLRLAQRSGPAAARNLGWRSSRSEVVAFTDDDCLPQPGWLHGLATGSETFVLVHGRTDLDLGEGHPDAFARWVEIPEFSHFYETCNIAYRRELLDRLDGFDEGFGFSRGGAPNGEDIDLGWRAVEFGASTGFAADAVVRHPVSWLTFSNRVRSQLRSARMVYAVRRHPGLRDHLPGGRYFFDPAHPYAMLALGGLVAGGLLPIVAGGPVAVASVAPYTWYRLRRSRPGGRRRDLPYTIPGRWLVDLTDVGVLAIASVRWRTVLL